MYNKPTPNPNYKPKPLGPRKVKGGIKLASPNASYPESWAAQRWLRLLEQAAPGEVLLEGLGYAAAGQARRIAIEPGRASGSIQGSQYTPYETTISIKPFGHEASEKLITAMSDQAVHAAKLLAGELLPTIEDVLGPLGLRLFPTEPVEITPRCTCRFSRLAGAPDTGVGLSSFRAADAAPSSPADTPPPAPAASAPAAPDPAAGPVWCKHACCLAFLVAEKLSTDAFLMFALRGLAKEELLERLRQRRAVAGSALGASLVYQPVVPGVSDATAKPLEECLDDFWEAGPELARIEAPLERPQVAHPLLRRLGPSPMGGPGKFPIVGLLATCYDVISEAVVKGEASETARDDAADAPQGESEDS